MRRGEIIVGVLLAALAAACFSSALALSPPSKMLMDLFTPKNVVNAVHLDGNTSLSTPSVWNVPANGSTFFMSWWENIAAPNPLGGATIFYVEDAQHTELLEVDENEGMNNEATLEVVMTLQVGGQSQRLQIVSASPVLPRVGQWCLVQVSVNFGASPPTGEYNTFCFPGPNYMYGVMYPGTNISGSLPWISANNWKLFGNGDAHNFKPIGDFAELFVHLGEQWFLSGGHVASVFATNYGFARGLDYRNGLPITHNCADPLAGTVPTMCNRGDDNAFPIGPEASPGIDAYVMTVTGTLTKARTDPCFRGRIGDGCEHFPPGLE